MLTMLLINKDGSELVKEIDSVMKRPAKESASNASCLTYFEKRHDGNQAVDVFDGTMFIMNENGKTVANYVVSSEWKEIK
jgi:hypothetical protein